MCVWERQRDREIEREREREIPIKFLFMYVRIKVTVYGFRLVTCSVDNVRDGVWERIDRETP